MYSPTSANQPRRHRQLRPGVCSKRRVSFRCPNPECDTPFWPVILLPNAECKAISLEDVAEEEECSLGLPKDLSTLPRITCPTQSLPDADIDSYCTARSSMRSAFLRFRKVYGEESVEWKRVLGEFTIQCMLHQETLSKCTFDPFQIMNANHVSLVAQVETDCKMWFRRHLGDDQTRLWWEQVEELGWWLVHHDCKETPMREGPDDIVSEGRVAFRDPFSDSRRGSSSTDGGSFSSSVDDPFADF
ncbi:hypothetical protein PFICI_00220 [Pestalotiopsis fici W106-1]|uniref:Uncharacterized protein n=1 Tax=Pestalotiopsis fici (strain W106-1 / CGMCC3.15140) TaxID=1229662 RepID=W3XLQ1_PESFW|nr:uncharacterized protein PFICI_00220 [Pestalotiopsis fici W106-1]ETS86392.1 hypothetical protein PFICI_00220 [Pestalotiopsis fici W106-1]